MDEQLADWWRDQWKKDVGAKHNVAILKKLQQDHREQHAFMTARHNRVESLEYQLQVSDYEKGE